MRIRKTAMIALVGITALAVAAQDGLLLRRTITEGTTEVYTVETTGKQVITMPNGMGEQEMGSTMIATYQVKVGKFDAEKKVAPVDISYTIDKMEMEGAMAGMMGGGAETNKPITMSGTISDRGRMAITPAKGASGMAEMMSGAQSFSSSTLGIELPDKTVKIGDSWDIIVPKSDFTGGEDQKLVAKLTGEKDVDGKPGYVISVSGTIKTNADLSKMMEQAEGPMKGQKMMVKGNVEITTDGVVDKATGRTLRATTKTKMKQTVEMPDMGMSIDTGGVSTSVLKAKS